MPSLKIRDIPYLADAAPLLEAIRELGQAVWLDSGRPKASFGRYDILSARPRLQLINTGPQTLIRSAEAETRSSANPIDLVDRHLQAMNWQQDRRVPFCGGALGYFGYNLFRHLEPSLRPPPRDIALPDMAIGLYDWALVQDHHRQRACLLAQADMSSRDFEELARRLSSATNNMRARAERSSFKISDLQSNFQADTYARQVGRIQDYIRAGDCYQVNFAQRFSARFDGDPFAAYCHLRQLLPGPYSAYLELDGAAVLSHSPERFLQVNQRRVETKPIKGTAPRHPDPAQDRANALALSRSAKDRAENLMIVDLLRNDLSKNCELGSVQVPSLFQLESYANVHHLVSTVTGQLRGGRSALQLLKGCFPGGSITGAPKLRAMDIITELEQCDRSVYCGSIGYVSPDGNMDSNIAIRSLVYCEDRIYCWGGGGIVADSQPVAEYAESLAKIRVLLEGLGGRL